MNRVGSAVLPLHGGYAPRWLFKRMKSLASGIVSVIVDEFGRDELLRRLSDPFWFQSLGCVLGYDWHSSGVTTVVTGALREVVDPKAIGIAICGGKGKRSTRSSDEIHQYGSLFQLSDQQIQQLKYASRIVAKVDNAAIQTGYPLYHHSFFMTVEGKWSVVQQGMSVSDKTARRYHWLSDGLTTYVDEPHEAIVGDVVRPLALDMTSKESGECRAVSLDLVREGVGRVRSDLLSLRPEHQRALTEWMDGVRVRCDPLQQLSMPRNISWEAVRRAYEFQPENYEELISIRGIGPGAVRALALISEVIYGAKPSWKDPVKYSFALGGKDGVPFPVDRESYDETIQFLRLVVEKSRLEGKVRCRTLERLKLLTPSQMLRPF
jgi:hypothetical protein